MTSCGPQFTWIYLQSGSYLLILSVFPPSICEKTIPFISLLSTADSAAADLLRGAHPDAEVSDPKVQSNSAPPQSTGMRPAWKTEAASCRERPAPTNLLHG